MMILEIMKYTIYILVLSICLASSFDFPNIKIKLPFVDIQQLSLIILENL